METIGTKIEIIKSLCSDTGSVMNLLVVINETQSPDESKMFISYSQ